MSENKQSSFFLKMKFKRESSKKWAYICSVNEELAILMFKHFTHIVYNLFTGNYRSYNDFKHDWNELEKICLNLA